MSRRQARAAKPKIERPQAKYDAAGTGRRIRTWNPPSTGPNRATQGLQRIRDRARDSSRNDWAGASTVQKWATNLIGVGIIPRWANKKFLDLWKLHVPFADADGVLDVYGMQTLAARSWVDAGEVFLRRRPRDLALGLPSPVQYQLIEADFVPLFDTTAWPGMPPDNTMNQGIERNKYGRRVAYWLYREHPGDKPMRPSTNDLVRVLASDIRHIFEPLRPGQLRGVSQLAPILVRLRSSMDFEDAVLDRQKLANLFVAFITRQIPDDAEFDYDPDTGLPKWYDKDGTPMAALEPGIMQELQPGENVTFANPPEAGTTFSDYMRTTHEGSAAATGLPYELMSGNIKDVSDRAMRIVIQEFRRLARQRQWQVIIPMLCQPMVDWWAEACALNGTITAAEVAEAKAPKWSPEGWEYIHPVQDAQGKIALIGAGITSRDAVIGERGDDPRDIDDERKAGKEREDKLGLTPPPPPAPVAPAPKPAPKAELDWQAAQTRAFTAQAELADYQRAQLAAPPAGPSEAEQMRTHVATLVENMTRANAAMFASAMEHANTLAGRPMVTNVAAPVINNEVHVEPTPIVNEQHTHVEPTPIVNEVHAHVEPTPVQITNEVHPAAVEVSVSLPDRKTTSVIDRDRDGFISEVTQMETTIQ